jgi:redox-sensitive bicupin YhaK (pirin superfamily)
MPAISVSDVTLLPRTPVVDLLTARPRPVVSLTTAPSGFEGEGFPVRRAFMGAPLNAIDPFIMLDQMGEVDYAPGEPKGTPWHPHRGFETVTYMLDGILDHRDSNGGGGRISDGDTQWMTAGGGILHIETPPEFLVASGGLFHGFQLWVNLPRVKKWSPPAYQDIRSSEVKLLASPDGGALLRLIAGEVGGFSGPGATQTPIALVHVYALSGRGSVGVEGIGLQSGQLAVYGDGDRIVVKASRDHDARTPALDVLILGGLPIREPVAWLGPFVMNTRDEVIQAFEDYRAGRLGVTPAAHSNPHNTPTSVIES